ncbi:hypothetical protein EB820_18855 [Brevibacillus agri]|uniref:Uncharacterized protein n=1 Tax=Brevibacillus agri TaxID=51101 RepID=A0A3M8ANA6_9BACL|nr:hypothetical protein D478_19714 [Brevibacillus agri BAB-2500]QAV11374.1 hypothetical protein BA6348_00320 [Brevibacillus agri]RNB52573.1 hypothetical protein EB820_18855 [Brevibacillus agri]
MKGVWAGCWFEVEDDKRRVLAFSWKAGRAASAIDFRVFATNSFFLAFCNPSTNTFAPDEERGEIRESSLGYRPGSLTPSGYPKKLQPSRLIPSPNKSTDKTNHADLFQPPHQKIPKVQPRDCRAR